MCVSEEFYDDVFKFVNRIRHIHACHLQLQQFTLKFDFLSTMGVI